MVQFIFNCFCWKGGGGVCGHVHFIELCVSVGGLDRIQYKGSIKIFY